MDIEEHEKYFFWPLYGNVEDSLMKAHDHMINELQWKGEREIMLHFQWETLLYSLQLLSFPWSHGVVLLQIVS